MSTSDLAGVAGLESLSASQAGLPDPAQVAAWANAFFQEAPIAAQAVVAAKAAVNAAQPVAQQQQAKPPTDVSGLSLPATVVPAAAPALPTSLPAISIPGVPGIPGGFSAADLSSEPSFGFLSEARSLFAGVPALPVEAAPLPTTRILPDSDLHRVQAGLPGAAALPAIPTEAQPVAVPAIPGAVGRNGQRDGFGFLEQAAPIASFDAVPVLEPLAPAVPTAAEASTGGFDVAAIRRDFPILSEQVNGRQLVWLDNAATTQKPQAVIDRLAWFYQHENSNIHRAAHTLAARSTDAYEGAREKVRRFLNASDAKEIVFVRGATEGINLVAQSWGKRHIERGDEIIVSHLEHHANIVPWQMLAAEKGARLKVAPVDDSGQILLDQYERLFTSKTKLVSVTQVSNALGTVTPVAELVEIAHRHGAKILIDGAQSVSHLAVDVQALGPDFFVFSGHKVFAPTGIGVVYGTSEVLEASPPYQGGGNMIADVTFEKTVYNPPPSRFEAGTGNIADAVGLGAAIDYVERVGMANISRYEHELLAYGTEALRRVNGVRLIGTATEKASVLSFVLDGYTTQQVGEHLSKEGIAVRSGHHCAQPILRRFGLESTVRPSLAFYNTCEEIDILVAALWNLKGGRTPGPL